MAALAAHTDHAQANSSGLARSTFAGRVRNKGHRQDRVLLHMVGASLIDKKLTFGDVSAKNAPK